MSLIKLSLVGNYLIIPGQESLVSDISAGDEKIVHVFFTVYVSVVSEHCLTSSRIFQSGIFRRFSLFIMILAGSQLNKEFITVEGVGEGRSAPLHCV